MDDRDEWRERAREICTSDDDGDDDIYIYMYNIEKLNKLSFSFYEFISATDLIRETASLVGHHTMEREKNYIFSKDS